MDRLEDTGLQKYAWPGFDLLGSLKVNGKSLNWKTIYDIIYTSSIIIISVFGFLSEIQVIPYVTLESRSKKEDPSHLFSPSGLIVE